MQTLKSARSAVKARVVNKKFFVFLVAFFLIFSQFFSSFISQILAASTPWTQTDWSGGVGSSTTNQYSFASNITDSIAGQVTLSPTSGWCSNASCDSSWKYRKKITFNNTDANLGVTSENLVNFPVLVKLSSSSIDYAKTLDNGQDIRFTDTDGSDLAYEIEKWDETGSSFVWVKVPQIDINSSTDYIYLYYGNTSATDHQQATSVWNSNYNGVWHLKESGNGTSGEFKDSTNVNNGQGGAGTSTKTPTATSSGQIGNAQTFDGGDDYIKVTHNASLTLTTGLTFEAWIKPLNLTDHSYHTILGKKYNASFWFGLYEQSGRNQTWVGGGPRVSPNNLFVTGQWQQIVSTYVGGTLTMYRNGVVDHTISGIGGLVNDTSNLYIGADREGVTDPLYFFTGGIDEARISNAARSPAWIAASYKSGVDSFNSFNTEEERYYASGTLTSSIFDTEQASNWGLLTYNTDGVATTTVKARTSNSASMSGATDFSSCNAISSSSDISSNNCVTDTNRYIQYQISLTSVSANTQTFQDVSIAFTASDSTPPSISLTALSPDPNNDNTPLLGGSATDATATVSSVQFQMDGTSGSWTACTANDGSFNAATEAFTCNVSAVLSDGSHVIYVRATDSNGNTTSNVNAATDTFTIDTTAPTVTSTALSPDPTSDATPSISGTAMDATTALTAIEYQVDSTSGSWSSCTADDGTMNTASEAFTCAIDTPLSDGSHIIYVRATDSASNTTAQANYGTDTFVIDASLPTVSLTAISPDPGTNDKPVVSGTATDATGTITNAQFQVDTTLGSWTNCTANDGSFNSASESFSCTISTALTDGTHTLYVRATDNAGNNSSSFYDSITVDTTAPLVFDLDSPGDSSYTNSERPVFRWKATTDATSGLLKYSIEVDNGDFGDYLIDDIPTFRTTDYETNKYVAHYENFSDSDPTNNYVAVYTKSTNGWGSDNNDGKLKEGKRSWKVKATDNAGNERSESRTLLVDRTWPSVEITQVNDTQFSSNGFTTNDKTSTFYGKITDSLVGDKTGNKVSSGPKNVEVKIEKKNSLGLYNLHTLATVNLSKTYWTSDNAIIADNSQNKSDKYSTFEFRPTTQLPLGNYRVLIVGKDNADNFSSAQTFYLNIETYEQIIRPEEKMVAQEELPQVEGNKPFIPEQEEKIEPELEITKPTKQIKPSIFETTADKLTLFRNRLVSATVSLVRNVSRGISSGFQLAFIGAKQSAGLVLNITNNTLRATADKARVTMAFMGKTASDAARATGDRLTDLYYGTRFTLTYVNQSLEKETRLTRSELAWTGKTIGAGYNQFVKNAPEMTQRVLAGIGNGASTLTLTIASEGKYAVDTAIRIAQDTATSMGEIVGHTSAAIATVARKTSEAIVSVNSFVITGTTTLTKSVGFAIASTAQNGVEKLNDISHGVGTAIIKIGYLFLPEPTRISDVTAVVLSPTSVKISWKTNHPANGKVNWGYDDGVYEFEQQADDMTDQHEFILSNLKPDTEYHYEVMSQSKNYVYDANRQFKTLPLTGYSQ